MAQATNTQLGEIILAGDLAGNGGAQVGTNPQLKTMPGLTPGSYTIPTITVDAKGRVTAIASGGAGLADLLPHASTTRSGIVSVGDNLYIAGEPESGFWTVNFGGTLAAGTATGLSNQACAQYSFDLVVDTGAVQKVIINGSNAQTVTALVTALNAVMVGATAGLINGNIVIASNTEGKDSKIVISNVSLFGCITGFVSVGSATAGNGSCELYAKRGSNTDYGVVKIGSGIDVTDGVISVSTSAAPVATTTTLGNVIVPTSGRLVVDASGNLSVPLATASVPGVVQVGAGLSVASGVLSVDPNALPVATTSVKGAVQIGSGLSVTAGVVSVDAAAINLPAATTSVKGAVQIGSNLSVTAGVVSVPLATPSVLGVAQIGAGLSVSSGVLSVGIASAGTLGAIRVGTGLTIDGSGVLSTTAVPDATTSSKGLVQVGSGLAVSSGVLSAPNATSGTLGVIQVGAGLTVASGVLSMAPATASVLGAVKIGTGLSVDGAGVISATPLADATTSTKGIVQVGSGLNVASGVISAAQATSSAKGVVQIGTNLNVASGVVSAPLANGSTPGLVTSSSSGSLTISDGAISLSASVVRKDQTNIFTGVQSGTVIQLGTVSGPAVPLSTSNMIEWTNATATTTIINASPGFSGSHYYMIMHTHATQSSITFPASWKIKGYTTPSQGQIDIIEGVWQGSTFYGNYTKGFV